MVEEKTKVEFTEAEKEMIAKGQRHWKKVIPKKKFPRGGKVTNETLEFVIDNIVDDVWTKAKEFYTK